jgi:hypothetical protein
VWREDHNSQDFLTYKGSDVRIENLLDELKVNELYWEPEDTFGLNMGTVCPSQRSNFFKWDVLSEGCFYSDMDIVFTKSMDKMYESVKDYDAGLTFKDYFSIGFMFGANGNPLFKAVYENACRSFFPLTYQGAGVETLYKKWKNLDVMAAAFPELRVFNIPMCWMYNFNHLHLNKIFKENHFKELPDDALGIHWYAGSIEAQEFNNVLTEDTLSAFDNTLSSAIRFIL